MSSQQTIFAPGQGSACGARRTGIDDSRLEDIFSAATKQKLTATSTKSEIQSMVRINGNTSTAPGWVPRRR